MVAYIFVAVFLGMSLLVAVMTLAVSNAFQERLRQSLLPDPLMMSHHSAPDDLSPTHASRTTATRGTGSERTDATAMEPFLKGDSFVRQSLAAETDSGAGLGGSDAGDFGLLLSSRLIRLEQKIDMIAQIQSSVHEILLHREKIA
jgi:ABC-type lipoprotein release transport system permease subunit